MQNKTIKIYTDGATLGHNGKLGTVKEVGLGVYIPDLNFADCRRVDGISNNEAEFKALIWAMNIAKEKGVKKAMFCLDSLIVVKRANGNRPKGKFRNERMDAFQDEVFKLKNEFDLILFIHIPREQNATADYYSKEALK
jgi:ribonuclease HI